MLSWSDILDISIIAILMLLGYVYLLGRIRKARAGASLELEPVFQKYGFAKPPPPKPGGVTGWLAKRLGTGSGVWAGTYRKRAFEVSLFVPRGITQDIALSIRTQNRTGKTIGFKLYEKGKMEDNALSDIHARLDRLGMYSVLWRDSALGQWALFGVYKDNVSYILPGSLLSKDSFLESLDIICDTMDRLGI